MYRFLWLLLLVGLCFFAPVSSSKAAFSPPVEYKAALHTRLHTKATQWQQHLQQAAAAPRPERKPFISKRSLGVLMLCYSGLSLVWGVFSALTYGFVALVFGIPALAVAFFFLVLLAALVLYVAPLVYGILLVDGSYGRLSPNPVVAYQRQRREYIWGLLSVAPLALLFLAALVSFLITVSTLSFALFFLVAAAGLFTWATIAFVRRWVEARRDMLAEQQKMREG